MARIETDPNYTTPTFSRATAATDPFKKEDVQQVAAALSTHDHSTGKGLLIPFATTIPNGSITSAMIADATIDTADLKDGAVTSAKILDGTIATGDLAAGAVTNAKLGTDTARLSLLVNGGFEVWQRGNGPFTVNGLISADRWQSQLLGSATFSITRDTTNADGSGACMAAAVSGASSTANCLVVFQSTNLAPQVGGRTVTISIRVKSAVAGSVCSYWYDGVTGGATNQFGAPVATSASYSTLTFTLTPSSTATQLNVGLAFLANTTYYLDSATLVLGAVAADYAPMHPADELARCQRYFQIVGETPNELWRTWIAQAAGHVDDLYLPYLRKALVPTVTKNGTWVVVNTAQPAITSAAGLTGTSLRSVSIGGGTVQYTNNAAGANLTIEANP